MVDCSLRDVQAAYFDGLEQMFGKAFSEMKKHDVSCAEIAEDLASRDRIVAAFERDYEDFFASNREFWDRNQTVIDHSLQEMGCLKAVFGGDLSPSFAHNIALSAGLYIDTLVIPDPIVKMADLGEHLTPQKRLYLTAKHALNALTYRDLALADVDPPIIIFVGDLLRAEGPKLRELVGLADIDLLSHFEQALGRPFADSAELRSFLSQFKTVEEFSAAVLDPGRILFDVDWPNDPAEQIRRHTKTFNTDFTEEVRPRMTQQGPGLFAADHMRSRLMQINDIIQTTEQLGATPVVEAPTSWQYLVWKYEYDASRNRPGASVSREHLVTTRALQAADDDGMLRILSVTPSVLIDLRRKGVMEDLREILRGGIRDIELASHADVERVTVEIAAALSSAFQEHQRRQDELIASGIRWYGAKFAPMVISAAMSILGAATGNVPLATAGAISTALGAPTAKDVIKDAKSLAARHRQLRRSATGILFRNM